MQQQYQMFARQRILCHNLVIVHPIFEPKHFPSEETHVPIAGGCRAETKLVAMRATYGTASCSLATVNSGSASVPAVDGSAVSEPTAGGSSSGERSARRDSGLARVWRAHLAACLPGGGAGEPSHRPPEPPQVLVTSAAAPPGAPTAPQRWRLIAAARSGTFYAVLLW